MKYPHSKCTRIREKSEVKVCLFMNRKHHFMLEYNKRILNFLHSINPKFIVKTTSYVAI